MRKPRKIIRLIDAMKQFLFFLINLPREPRLILAAQFSLVLLLLATTARAQIAIQDGPMLIAFTNGTTALPTNQFTVTAGASVLVVMESEKGGTATGALNNPKWGSQALTLAGVATTGNTKIQSSIYYLWNPAAITTNVTATSPNTNVWLSAFTLSNVDTTIAPTFFSSLNGGGVTPYNTNTVTGVTAGAYAAVNGIGQNAPINVGIFALGSAVAVTTSLTNAVAGVAMGYVTNLAAGANSFVFTNSSLGTPQKAVLVTAVFSPPSTNPVSAVKAFGIKFLGNTTDSVTNTAGIYPISGWNNIANGSYTSGTIYSSDGSVAATLTLSGSGSDNTWKSGIYPDGGNFSLMDGYQDAGQNNPATDVISGLTGAAYDVYLYTGGDNARPSSGTDYLPNYTINGTIYYTATLKGYDSMLKMVQGVPTSQNSNTYPTAQMAGHYLKISNVVPIGGKITITANADNLTYRSPLNGIELVSVGNAPQVVVQPLAHRLYTGGTAQFQVQVEGANPLAYQWRQNGTNLFEGGRIMGSQSNSLTITNLALTDTGNYDVVITNSYGSVTSSVANLNMVVETTADAAYEAWVAAYVVTNGYQTYIVNSLQNRNFSFMWQQAYMIWMLEDTYDRTQSPDQQQLINALLNTFIWQNHSDLTWDGWDDDLEWGEMALIRGYEITGNGAAFNSAVFNWNAVMSRGWDSTYGGGIWEQLPPPTSKCALSCCPQVIAGIHLFQITGQTNYLTTSQTIYNWTWTNLFIATSAQATNGMTLGQVNEGIAWADTNHLNTKVLVSNNSYNSGLFAMAASLLYQATGTTQYLSDAILAENQKVNKEPILNEDHVANGDFGGEMLIRGAVLIASQDHYNLWPTYGPWLQAQCPAAWSKRRTDYNITHNNWTTATPAGTNDLDSMESECAVLVQQMAISSLPGFATNFTLNYGGTPIAENTGNDWNNGNIWNPGGLSAATSAVAYPASTFEAKAGSRLRSPTTAATFPGNQLTLDGSGVFENLGGGNPANVSELRFKNNDVANYFSSLVLNGGELDAGNNGTLIIQGNMNVAANSTIYVDNSTTTDRGVRIDSNLTGPGNLFWHEASGGLGGFDLQVTGAGNTFSGQWLVDQGALVGVGVNSLGTNNIIVGTNGLVAAVETLYDLNNTNASLVLGASGQMFLHQTNHFASVIINGAALTNGIYSFTKLNSTYPAKFPSSWTQQAGSTFTTGSGQITVGNVVVGPPSPPQITAIGLNGTGLSLSATKGTPGGPWALLQSTNIALPLSQWQTNATGIFDGSGNLATNILNTATNLQEFYLLKVQ
jgi:Glycosyl hydrolase family 76/Immunoglobulin I-set domain